jgi:hypothetical protein
MKFGCKICGREAAEEMAGNRDFDGRIMKAGVLVSPIFVESFTKGLKNCTSSPRTNSSSRDSGNGDVTHEIKRRCDSHVIVPAANILVGPQEIGIISLADFSGVEARS